jgi:hypothetical protein
LKVLSEYVKRGKIVTAQVNLLTYQQAYITFQTQQSARQRTVD